MKLKFEDRKEDQLTAGTIDGILFVGCNPCVSRITTIPETFMAEKIKINGHFLIKHKCPILKETVTLKVVEDKQ